MPLQWGHGVDAVDTLGDAELVAQLTVLQWGHGVDAVDTVIQLVENCAREDLLQWGHGVDAVDTPAAGGEE